MASRKERKPTSFSVVRDVLTNYPTYVVKRGLQTFTYDNYKLAGKKYMSIVNNDIYYEHIYMRKTSEASRTKFTLSFQLNVYDHLNFSPDNLRKMSEEEIEEMHELRKSYKSYYEEVRVKQFKSEEEQNEVLKALSRCLSYRNTWLRKVYGRRYVDNLINIEGLFITKNMLWETFYKTKED